MKKKIMALAMALMLAASLTAYAAPEDEAAEEAGTETEAITQTDAASDADASVQADASTDEGNEGILDKVGEKIADEAMEGIVNLAIDEADKAGDLEDDSDSDLVYITHKGTLIVGVSDFVPMVYKDANGDWAGFDVDMAKAFARQQNVDIQFVEIDWDNKLDELNAKNIDCVWSGMTKTDDIAQSMECSNAYMNNAQVVVVKAEDAAGYTDTASIAGLSFAAKDGSYGQAVLSVLGYTDVTPVGTMDDALKAVEDGTCDAAVVDLIMAESVTAEGAEYADLAYTVSLASDEYVVGFRKGSDMPDMVNLLFKYGCQDGTAQACAKQYGVDAALIDQSQAE